MVSSLCAASTWSSGTSQNPLITTAVVAIAGSRMARLSSVVLPLPRKPVRMVTGVCGNARSLKNPQKSSLHANIEWRDGHCEPAAKATKRAGLKFHAAPRIAFRQRLEVVAREEAEAEPGAAMQKVRMKTGALA